MGLAIGSILSKAIDGSMSLYQRIKGSHKDSTT